MMNTLKIQFNINEPIFFDEIMNINNNLSRPRVYQLIKEMIEKQELIRFSDGIYYIPSKSTLGLSKLDVRKIIEKKYIQNKNEIYGIYGGLTLVNGLGISTQVPAIVEVVTNNESTRTREIMIGNQKVRLNRSRFRITKENANEYMLLEILNSSMFDNDILNNKQFIEKLNIDKLIKYAKEFPSKVSRNLLQSGVLNVNSQR